jgi:IS5 family transposase
LRWTNGLKLAGGSIADVASTEAPSPTRNTGHRRDPEIEQTKKGNQRYFGMKVRVGAGGRTSVTQSAVVTAGMPGPVLTES